MDKYTENLSTPNNIRKDWHAPQIIELEAENTHGGKNNSANESNLNPTGPS